MIRTPFAQHLETLKPNPLVQGLFKCSNNHDITNLGTAENKLIGDMIMNVLKDRSGLTPCCLTYCAASNTTPLCEAVAALYRDHFGIADAHASEILVGNGISFIIERLGLVLATEKDTILVPGPGYGKFETDLHMCKAKIEYIDLDNLPPAPPENAKMLILTNPGNPYGDLISDQDKLLQWAYQNPNLHIITDDIYALSNRRGESFKSIVGRDDADPERVHQCYGMSKDWALAGFHVGFFYSKNKELLNILKKSFGAYLMSSDTQWICTRLLADKVQRDKIISTYRNRLIHAEKTCMEMLQTGKIKARGCDNSLFILIDLTDIAGESVEKELQVWTELMDKYKVHILPGAAGFHIKQPGWYRVCFTFQDEVLIEGLNRLITGVKEMRGNK